MSRCMYCGNICRETAIYVIGERESPPSVKVGYTGKPTKRLASIRKKTGRDVAILAVVMAHCEYKAMDIEEAAHITLAPHWIGRGEWFTCSPDVAIAAVQAAGKKLGLGGERP